LAEFEISHWCAERQGREFGIDAFGDRPADDASRAQIEQDGEIPKAVHDADVREVRRPRLMDVCQAPPGQPVRVYPMRVSRSWRMDKGPFDVGVQSIMLHPPADSPRAYKPSPTAQLPLPWAVAGPGKVRLHRCDRIAKLCLLALARGP
jgi:hypothetical protein